MSNCFLCAGKCRGHSLGHPEQWVPEPGSQAAEAEARHQEALRDAEQALLGRRWSSEEAERLITIIRQGIG